MWNLYPKLRIHVWGGLGSQLYAWALLENLKVRFPRRHPILVLHNSGVTRREEELSEFFTHRSIQIKRDFSDSSLTIISIQKTIKAQVKIITSRVLKSLKFLAASNSEQEYLAIKPWVLSLRGHYTELRISKESVKAIFSSIGESNRQNQSLINVPSLGIHFRMGDLLALETKSPLEVSRLMVGLRMGLTLEPISTHLIFSDSPEEAKVLLDENCPGIEFQIQETNPVDTILELVNVKIFIGTPSKISEWVAIIRCYKLTQPNVFLPIEMKNHMETVLGCNSTIDYY